MKPRKNPSAVALGRKGRAVNSQAQQDAARENGKKGGRPPSYCCRKCGAYFTTSEAEAMELRDHLVLHNNGKEWCGPVFRVGGRPKGKKK